ncbi:MAG: GspMb/PilO family protein, partial [Betaproteobacteria bacterium]
RSAGLAANAVQALLQEAADGAGLLVNRVEVDAEPDSTGALTATLSAYGDVHGLAELLRMLDAGPRVAEVRRLTVQQNSALRGAPDVIQVSIGVRAPVLIIGADNGGTP